MHKFILNTGIHEFDPSDDNFVGLGSLVLSRTRCETSDSYIGISVAEYLRDCQKRLIQAIKSDENGCVLVATHGVNNLKVVHCSTGYYVSFVNPIKVIKGDSLVDCLKQGKFAPSFESMVTSVDSFDFESSVRIPDWFGGKVPWSLNRNFEVGIRAYIDRMAEHSVPWVKTLTRKR
jgi:hypothetical protein